MATLDLLFIVICQQRENTVFDLFDDVEFECQNNSAEEEDGERREYEDGGVISDSRGDQDSDNHDDECPKKTRK